MACWSYRAWPGLQGLNARDRNVAGDFGTLALPAAAKTVRVTMAAAKVGNAAGQRGL
jgi:hypothetical protein